MKKIKTKIKGLFIVKTKVFKDNRGWLKEEFQKKFVNRDLVFTVVSNSRRNVLRGLHMQTKKPQDKFLSVVKGKVLDVAVDLRKNSKTYGKHFAVEIEEKSDFSLFIPENFAHGFLCLSKFCAVYYKCTNYRDAKSETTIRWDDKKLNIKWPIKRPILSRKDSQGILFEDF